jgi:hypothetical protein
MFTTPTDQLFDDILEFLASAPTSQAIVDYQPSAALQERLTELLQKNKRFGLTETENAELDEFSRINRMMSRLRLKARKYVAK